MRNAALQNPFGRSGLAFQGFNVGDDSGYVENESDESDDSIYDDDLTTNMDTEDMEIDLDGSWIDDFKFVSCLVTN